MEQKCSSTLADHCAEVDQAPWLLARLSLSARLCTRHVTILGGTMRCTVTCFLADVGFKAELYCRPG